MNKNCMHAHTHIHTTQISDRQRASLGEGKLKIHTCETPLRN